MRGLVDLHCHILPGLDDGARDVADALAMAGQAERDGIEVVCATPHIRHDHDVEIAALRGQIAALNDELESAGSSRSDRGAGERSPRRALDGLDDEELRAVSLGGGGRWILLEPAPGPLGRLALRRGRPAWTPGASARSSPTPSATSATTSIPRLAPARAPGRPGSGHGGVPAGSRRRRRACSPWPSAGSCTCWAATRTPRARGAPSRSPTPWSGWRALRAWRPTGSGSPTTLPPRSCAGEQLARALRAGGLSPGSVQRTQRDRVGELLDDDLATPVPRPWRRKLAAPAAAPRTRASSPRSPRRPRRREAPIIASPQPSRNAAVEARRDQLAGALPVQHEGGLPPRVTITRRAPALAQRAPPRRAAGRLGDRPARRTRRAPSR